MEQLQVLRQEAEVQTTNFIKPQTNSSSPTCNQQQIILYSPNNLQHQSTSVNSNLPNGSVSSLPRVNRYHLPQSQSFCRQTSVPVQRTQSMLSPVSYLPSNGSNSANVTLTRGTSRVPSRSSASCAPFNAKHLKHNSNVDSYSSENYSNFHQANAIDPLLNDEVR